MKKKVNSKARNKSGCKAESMSLDEIGSAIDMEVSSWKGNCFCIATRMVEAGLVSRGKARYGHFLGEVRPDSLRSFVRSHENLGFVNHGWIEVPRTKKIIDPTRWVFDSIKNPYLFVGSFEEYRHEYDVGGNTFRASLHRQPPRHDPKERQVSFPADMELSAWLRSALCCGESQKSVSLGQLFHVANMDVNELMQVWPKMSGWFKEIKAMALLPFDNRLLLEEMQKC